MDRRTLRIPNRLTFPFIISGLALLPLRCDPAMSGLAGAVSLIFVYGLWKCGLWGGGDAKLVLAMFILVSPAYPPLLFIAVLPLCLALVLFAKHLIVGRKAGPMGPALLVAYVSSVAALEVFGRDDRGVDSLPLALASSLIILAAIVALAALGLREAGPMVSTASVDGQVSGLANGCRALLAGSPRDLLDPASPPGSSMATTLSLPPDTGYVSFGGGDDEGTIYYEVHGNRKAVVIDGGVKLREGVKKGDIVVPSRGHRSIEGGGEYELTIEYEYDRGLGERYLVIY